MTCVVNRSHPQSLEPHCFDAEASATVLQMGCVAPSSCATENRGEEIDREIAAGLLSGRYRFPRRPAMSYMMSREQVLYSDEGRNVGRWHPHLMITIPT